MHHAMQVTQMAFAERDEQMNTMKKENHNKVLYI